MKLSRKITFRKTKYQPKVKGNPYAVLMMLYEVNEILLEEAIKSSTGKFGGLSLNTSICFTFANNTSVERSHFTRSTAKLVRERLIWQTTKRSIGPYSLASLKMYTTFPDRGSMLLVHHRDGLKPGSVIYKSFLLCEV
jgi:hypothetical protein